MQHKKEDSNKVKATTYFKNQFKAHIKLKPTGALDCLFTSELIDESFYWIMKLNKKGKPEKKDMLFLLDIYDVKPYEELVEDK